MSRFSRFLFFLLILSFVLISCDSSSPEGSSEFSEKARKEHVKKAAISKIIGAHTSGIISRKENIKIMFVNTITSKEDVGKNAEEYIDISPSTKGTITFKNSNTILIVPSADLKGGETYKLRVKLGKFSNIANDTDDYEFELFVVKQDLEIKIEGLAPEKDLRKSMEASGVLLSADVIEAEDAEKSVSASYIGKDIPLKWNHNINGREHKFTAGSLKRGDSDKKLVLKFDGSHVGVDKKGSKEVLIPAAGEFKIIKAKALKGDNRYIAVYFSDNISTKQSLKGMVTANGRDYQVSVNENILRVYVPRNIKGKIDVKAFKGIKSIWGDKLKDDYEQPVAFTNQHPQVKFVGKGVVLPENKTLSIPFMAINASSVQVTAMRVYENNMGQFLQENQLSGNRNIGRVGRNIWRKKIYISSLEPDKWGRYSLDATKLLTENPGGLFRLELSIDREDSAYSCSEKEEEVAVKPNAMRNNEDLNVKERSRWNYYDEYYDDYNERRYDWKNRNNPCHDDYYRLNTQNVRASRNFYASNIGIIVKRGLNGHTTIATTNLKTSEVMPGVKINIKNFQDQLLNTLKTDSKGFAEINLVDTPFYLEAEKGGQKGYLKLNTATALPVSHFNIGGENITGGTKGFIYGERGVWRPGDNIYLTFVLQDRDDVIPPNHPVTMQLINPKGQMIDTKVNANPVDDFYVFEMKTSEDGLTGNWTAKATIGGATFNKKVKVETVAPNRLKVELNFPDEEIYKDNSPLNGTISAQWLNGAKVSGFKTDTTVNLNKRKTKFKNFDGYNFDDPARKFSGTNLPIFEGNLDANGNIDFTKNINTRNNPPGMLKASFTTRVFEKSGAFSINRKTIKFHPYTNYVGMKLPAPDNKRGRHKTGKNYELGIVSLSDRGKPVGLEKVEITMHRLNWRWWWDRSGENLTNYANSRYYSPIKKEVISTKNGKGFWTFKVNSTGRYLIRACDLSGNHCTGKTVYIGWNYASKDSGSTGAARLNFNSDKQKYRVGETAKIKLPDATEGRALVSIENGSGIIGQEWIELKKGSNTYELPLTREMSPNIYVNITLIQPHEGKNNDRPIRVYGIIPIFVEDPTTTLHPVINSTDEWIPESKVSFKVSEKDNRSMTYTVAVVDEGLLGLTSYKSPDLWDKFYRKEALGVKTWDMFDFVTGAYGGSLERLLALGGDGAEDAHEETKEDKRRFPPVVKFFGPFSLDGGKTNKHEFDLPQYIGSLRIMVIAGKHGAYGNTSKNVFVKDALTILPTMPRVVGPKENIAVPVSVFVMDDKIKDVTLTVKTNDYFTVQGDGVVNIKFDGEGDKIGTINLSTKSKLGKGKVSFKAVSGSNVAESDIYIDIRSPNVTDRRAETFSIAPDESHDFDASLFGLDGTNELSYEVSSVPPLNLEKRLNYLIRYPHGCVEQTTSGAFPQLFLPEVMKLSDVEKKKIENNVSGGIERLRKFQTSAGGFGYWPGDGQSHIWATNYVGHFLIEAQKRGYVVPNDMLSNWVKFQKSRAQSWSTDTYHDSINHQVYRLFTLALASKAEIGAMNRLMESKKLSAPMTVQLAAAYKLAGLDTASQSLLKDLSLEPENRNRPGASFWSSLRDYAIILDGLSITKEFAVATDIANRISKQLNDKHWHSTQSIAYSLMAMSRYIGGSPLEKPFVFVVKTSSGKSEEISSQNPVYVKKDILPMGKGEVITITNKTDRAITATVVRKGIPDIGEELTVSAGLSVTVRHKTPSGEQINISSIKQGEDFVAIVKIKNNTPLKMDNVALSHIVPSGWEIHNERLDNDDATIPEGLDYQDIRDDRVYSYFSINSREEKTVEIKLNAAYLGTFYMPGINVEAMYDATKNGRTEGKWVKVIE